MNQNALRYRVNSSDYAVNTWHSTALLEGVYILT
jgi:hypothetical protein